ncbi:MAG TPA: hypothetical protein VE713_06695 [Pyrinomonadaceae bacterium]|nr:hypothetical protein [Pyrinomonadaceae bacterium]
MSTTTPALRLSSPPASDDDKCVGRALLRVLAACIMLFALPALVRAQSKGLPAPDRVVADYVKAVGGKKRVAALRDASYEWAVASSGADAGTARTQLKSSGALRTDFILADGERDAAANARAAWTRTREGQLQTLTGTAAFDARLQATLEAAWFADYKRQKVLARTAAREEVGGEPAYLVEFTTRAGARLRYWFGATSKLLLQMSDEARALRVRYLDWRAQAGSPLLKEPHRLEVSRGADAPLTLTLREARYNTNLADSLFEPPSDSSLDIPALLRELAKNQDEDDKRINDYTFTQKITERELNDRGELKKEKVSVYEVYPVADYGWVRKLVSENGAALAPERAAKEEKRVGEELEKAVREAPKMKEKRERARAEMRKKQRAKSGGKSGEGGDDDDPDVGISTFLRAAEFVSPRRERLGGHDVIVFDFRPRAGFKPSTQAENIVSKLSGVIWVDPAQRQVVRLEARLVDTFKVGGGLLASLKSGSAFVFEQTQLSDGVWLPRFAQINMSARILLFAGMSVNETEEYSDYKRFSTKSGEDKLDAPKEKSDAPKEKPPEKP